MPLKVVYIDDEVDLCQLFRDIFASDRVAITTFSDPKEAIREMKQLHPDLVFIDYQLSDTTGDQVADRLDPSVPMALVTGDFGVKLVPPFVRRFGKPFDFDEIEKFIESFFS